jgi:hypothetical protein
MWLIYAPEVILYVSTLDVVVQVVVGISNTNKRKRTSFLIT